MEEEINKKLLEVQKQFDELEERADTKLEKDAVGTFKTKRSAGDFQSDDEAAERDNQPVAKARRVDPEPAPSQRYVDPTDEILVLKRCL